MVNNAGEATEDCWPWVCLLRLMHLFLCKQLACYIPSIGSSSHTHTCIFSVWLSYGSALASMEPVALISRPAYWNFFTYCSLSLLRPISSLPRSPPLPYLITLLSVTFTTSFLPSHALLNSLDRFCNFLLSVTSCHLEMVIDFPPNSFHHHALYVPCVT